ncbi:MAG TPA: response regulator transcription factor [Pirellulaceae bacterium]|nr:response regulator transcription factor [Pirellulaceae bacterium]HMO90685.1 response regulator transcription factor [Pirellulaceae bacterium]HMP67736.1 response regulator transcription factor [Pirellulaceae bacterium]
MKYRIILADDHNLVRSGLVAILNQDDRFEVVAEATNGYEAIEKLKATRCDLLIADLAMPRLGGIEMIQMMRDQGTKVKILVLSMYDDAQFVVRAMNNGANGYLLKHAMDDELFRAIDAVLAGENYISELIDANALRQCRADDSELTSRELEVLKLISDGLTTPEIAELLDISPNTAVRHRANLMRKLNVHNRVELINTAFSRGLITIA